MPSFPSSVAMIVGVGLLFTTFWRRRRPADLGAFALPPEITLLIADHLPEPAVTSLALTCRTLYNILSRPPCLNATDKKELLLLLEKDTPTVYFCHHCTKLHHWKIQWTGSISLFCKEGKSCSYRNSLRFGSTCYIPYHVARLLMNRHFFGSTHGPSLAQVETKSTLYEDPYKMIGRKTIGHGSVYARIIDNKLLLSLVTNVRGSPEALRAAIDFHGAEVCEHLHLAKKDCGFCVQIPELAKGNTAPTFFTPCQQTFGSCPVCLTDYSIEIDRDEEKEQYIVQVSAWRELGDCRNPFDWTWRGIRTPSENYGDPREQKYRAGIVRDRWNKADDIDSITEAEYVKISMYERRKAPRNFIQAARDAGRDGFLRSMMRPRTVEEWKKLE